MDHERGTIHSGLNRGNSLQCKGFVTKISQKFGLFD